jgi:hypothetical protein
MAGRAKSKARVAAEVSRLIGSPVVEPSKGSTIPKSLIRDAAKFCGLGASESDPAWRVAKQLVVSSGLEWPDDADSTGTPSGGGGTITLTGWKAILAAVQVAASRSESSETTIGTSSGNATVDAPLVAQVQPGNSMLRLLKDFPNKWWFVIAEFIDNSISSFDRDIRLKPSNSADRKEPSEPKLVITVDFSDNAVTVRDNAGGITRDDLSTALQLGRVPEDFDYLNRFGVGMKTAAFWIGSRVEVRTKLASEMVRREVALDLDEIEEFQVSVPIQEYDQPTSSHFTEIVISNLYHSKPHGRSLGKIRSYAASIYRRFLQRGDIEIRIDGQSLEFEPVTILKEPLWHQPSENFDPLPVPGKEPVEWRHNFSIEVPAELDNSPAAKARIATGWMGIQAHGEERKGSRKHAGILGFYRNRVVLGFAAGVEESGDGTWRPKELRFTPSGYVGMRLCGEIDLDEFDVGSHKNEFSWSEEQQEFLLKEIARQLEEKQFYTMMDLFQRQVRQDPRRRPSELPPLPPVGPTSPLPPRPPAAPPEPGNTGNSPVGTHPEDTAFLHSVNWRCGETTSVKVEWDDIAGHRLLAISIEGQEALVRVNRLSHYVECLHPKPDSLEEIRNVLTALGHAVALMNRRGPEGGQWGTLLLDQFEEALEYIATQYRLADETND